MALDSDMIIALVRRWISPSAGLKVRAGGLGTRAGYHVRRWISPSAGLKGPTTTIPCSRNCRQKMDKPECGIERALTPAKMPKVHLVRRWISPSAGLKETSSTWAGHRRFSQKMDKPECGIESSGAQC